MTWRRRRGARRAGDAALRSSRASPTPRCESPPEHCQADSDSGRFRVVSRGLGRKPYSPRCTSWGGGRGRFAANRNRSARGGSAAPALDLACSLEAMCCLAGGGSEIWREGVTSYVSARQCSERHSFPLPSAASYIPVRPTDRLLLFCMRQAVSEGWPPLPAVRPSRRSCFIANRKGASEAARPRV